MFDEILNMVKEQLGGNAQVVSGVPVAQQDDLHNEVATHITNGLASHAALQGGVGGLLDSLKNAATSGSPIAGAIEGSLVSSLASKFGFSPAITGAIAGALPGLLQKFAHKATDPNDNSITPDSISKSISDINTTSVTGMGQLTGTLHQN